MQTLEDLVAYLARALVDHPEAVEVKAFEEDRAVNVELKVAPTDIGKVIGRQGRTARAMRLLLSAAAVKTGKHAHLDIAG